MQIEAKDDDYVPSHSAAFTPPTSTPAAPSALYTHTVTLCQRPNEFIPPLEGVSRRQEPSVINRGPDVNKPCSPGPETARKWSNHTTSGEEGQLVRAATYIQEHLMRRSSACDEFILQTPKGLLERKAKLDAQRRASNVVSKDKKASVSLRLPEFSTESALPSRSQSKVVPSQPNEEAEAAFSQFETPRANKLHTETSESAREYAGIKCETADNGVQECSSAQPVEAVTADRCLFERLAEVEETEEELSTPACTEVKRFSCENLVSTRGARAYTHSPIASVALTPFSPLPAFLSQALHASQLSPELNRPSRKSPDNRDCEWQPVKVVSLLNTSSIGIRSPKSKAELGLRAVDEHLKEVVAIYSCKRARAVATSLSPNLAVPHANPLPHLISEPVVSQQPMPSNWSSPGFGILATKFPCSEHWLSKAISSLDTLNMRLYLQRARTGLVPVLKSNRHLADLYRPPKGPSSLELQDLTVNRQHRLTLRETNQMEREMH